LLVKYPTEGQVKSRLARQLSGNLVVALYRNFVIDILSTLTRSGIPFLILFHPMDGRKKFESWLGPHFEYLPQRGNTLGERLKNGFAHAFASGCRNAIALASDVPDVPVEVLHEACAALGKSEVVIGPSPDGGYYLLGFRRSTFTPEAFDDIPWGQSAAFRETMKRVRNVKRSVHLLPQWRDIDTLEDLAAFVDKYADNTLCPSTTLRYLRRHKGRVFAGTRSSGESNCPPGEEYR
jgi:rSAM/selenodomain-associated transferase 1